MKYGRLVNQHFYLAQLSGLNFAFAALMDSEFYSTDLQTGQVHMTVQLCSDKEGQPACEEPLLRR